MTPLPLPKATFTPNIYFLTLKIGPVLLSLNFLTPLHAKPASVDFQSKDKDEDQAHLFGVTFFYSFDAKSAKG